MAAGDDKEGGAAGEAAKEPKPGSLSPEPARQGSVRPSARPSRPPSLSPLSKAPGTGPRHNYRLLFAAVWIITQLALVLTADRRVDGAFGFRMFPESSWIKVVLYREVTAELDGGAVLTRVHVDNGVWTARDARGKLQQLRWYDRVPSPFWHFDREMPASYGAKTQLERLQGALDDVATHTPEDAETERLVLEVTVHRNGREAVVHTLTSPIRTVNAPAAPVPAPMPSSPPPETP